MTTSIEEDEAAYIMQDGSRYVNVPGNKIDEELDSITEAAEIWWENLPEDVRMYAFQAVVSRIYRGEAAGSSAGAIMAEEFGFTGYHYLMVSSNFDLLHSYTYIPTEQD